MAFWIGPSSSFRLMVDRIEFRDPNTTVWQITRNAPTPNNAPDYTRFLRVSALAYELQKRGCLSRMSPLHLNNVQFCV
jgi:hypothetical protein